MFSNGYLDHGLILALSRTRPTNPPPQPRALAVAVVGLILWLGTAWFLLPWVGL